MDTLTPNTPPSPGPVNPMNPVTPNQPPVNAGGPHSRAPWILVVTVLILAVLGLVWYAWNANLIPQPESLPLSPEDAATERLANQGTSDDVSAIETDLNAAALDGLDGEMPNIEAEIQ